MNNILNFITEKASFVVIMLMVCTQSLAQPETLHQPLPFLEGNPIWVYKYEHIPRLRDPNITCWIDTGDRVYTYYFLGRQKEIEGKNYTMLGKVTSVTSNSENNITFNCWLPVREDNGIIYTLTDSLLKVCEHEYESPGPDFVPYKKDELPYIQQGNECVLYNFSAKIGETLFPQKWGSTVASYGTYQLMDGTECHVLKTHWGYDLCEKLGFLNIDLALGIMVPIFGMIVSTNGDVYVNPLNAYYQDNTMLYKAPDAPEGLCVNDTCWTREDAAAYAPTYKADPYHDDVMAYIRGLQTATGIHNPQSQNSINRFPLIYDLQGRRLFSKPSRGIYLEDGKKRMVK